MIANRSFQNRPRSFWAHVRLISQESGYTQRVRRQPGAARSTGPIKIPTLSEITASLEAIGLTSRHIVGPNGKATRLGRDLLAYFDFRATVLNSFVEPRLMNAEQAASLFEQTRQRLGSDGSVPMNKQSGDKKKPAYFTAIINMLIRANCQGLPCDYDPRELTCFTKKGVPLRTLARRIDGAFPRPVNPLAVWEVKEYYYTTTFGSRVADGVYESLLDGMELEELREHEKIKVKHYLMVDAHFTWWQCGRSYLCRIVDMLHMGYVDEVLFGEEVVERMPVIVREWVQAYRSGGLPRT